MAIGPTSQLGKEQQEALPQDDAWGLNDAATKAARLEHAKEQGTSHHAS